MLGRWFPLPGTKVQRRDTSFPWPRKELAAEGSSQSTRHAWWAKASTPSTTVPTKEEEPVWTVSVLSVSTEHGDVTCRGAMCLQSPPTLPKPGPRRNELLYVFESYAVPQDSSGVRADTALAKTCSQKGMEFFRRKKSRAQELCCACHFRWSLLGAAERTYHVACPWLYCHVWTCNWVRSEINSLTYSGGHVLQTHSKMKVSQVKITLNFQNLWSILPISATQSILEQQLCACECRSGQELWLLLLLLPPPGIKTGSDCSGKEPHSKFQIQGPGG